MIILSHATVGVQRYRLSTVCPIIVIEPPLGP